MSEEERKERKPCSLFVSSSCLTACRQVRCMRLWHWAASMVYGIILLLNFAHGDIIMIGAYTAFYAMTAFHLHPIFSVVLAVITSTLLGVVIEKGRLYAASLGTSSVASDHGNRHLVPAGKRCAAAVRRRHQEHGYACSRQRHLWTGHGQLYRNFNDYRRSHRDGCPDASCPEDEARQGNARGFRGYKAAQLMGISLNKNHFLHLLQSVRRFAGIGSVLICIVAYSQASPTMGLDARSEGVRRGSSRRHRLDSRRP